MKKFIEIWPGDSEGHEKYHRARFEEYEFAKRVDLEDIELSDGVSVAQEIEVDTDYHLLIKRLSRRQIDILDLMERGYSRAEIARELKLSRRTIQSEIAHIKQKYSIMEE